MAPRLKRWVILSVVATVAIIGMLFSTSGAPISNVVWFGDYGDHDGPTPEARQIGRLKGLLHETRNGLEALENTAALTGILAHTDADPVVVRREGDRYRVEPRMTAEVHSFWDRLPARRREFRSVVLQGSEMIWTGPRSPLEPEGVCVVYADTQQVAVRLIAGVRATGGQCLFTEQFGPPGKGIRDWRRGVSGTLGWEGEWRRRRGWYGDDVADLEGATPVWFRDDMIAYRLGGQYYWREESRLQMACLVGRQETCEAATGVAREGWPVDVTQRYGYSAIRLPLGRLPQDLLREVGPEKFGRIWTSDDPIAVSYARETGTPMAEWLVTWAQHTMGTIPRDNALSLVGWLGAFVWIGLFGLLVAQRLKQRTVT